MKLASILDVLDSEVIARGVFTLVEVSDPDVPRQADDDAPAVQFVILVELSDVLSPIVPCVVSNSLV